MYVEDPLPFEVMTAAREKVVVAVGRGPTPWSRGYSLTSCARPSSSGADLEVAEEEHYCHKREGVARLVDAVAVGANMLERAPLSK
jgi:hypothetical protein